MWAKFSGRPSGRLPNPPPNSNPSLPPNPAARYEKFDHARKADLFRISLPSDQAQLLLAAIPRAVPRKLKFRLSTLRPPATITFLCPR